MTPDLSRTSLPGPRLPGAGSVLDPIQSPSAGRIPPLAAGAPARGCGVARAEPAQRRDADQT